MRFLILILAVFAISCTNSKKAEKALKDAGYEPIDVGGYGFFKCSEDDFFSTRFKAKSPNDKTREVTGTVCSGIFKGSTIRLD